MKLTRVLSEIDVLRELYRMMYHQFNIYRMFGSIIRTKVIHNTGECIDMISKYYVIRFVGSSDQIALTPMNIPILKKRINLLDKSQIEMLRIMESIYEDVKDIVDKMMDIRDYVIGVVGDMLIVRYYYIDEVIDVKLFGKYLEKVEIYSSIDEKAIYIDIKENKCEIESGTTKKECRIENIELTGDSEKGMMKILEYSKKLRRLLKEYYDRINKPLILLSVFP